MENLDITAALDKVINTPLLRSVGEVSYSTAADVSDAPEEYTGSIHSYLQCLYAL